MIQQIDFMPESLDTREIVKMPDSGEDTFSLLLLSASSSALSIPPFLPLSLAGDGVLVQAGVDRGMPDGSVKATLDSVSVLQVVGDGEVRPPLSAAGDGVLVQAGVDRGMPDGSVKATLDSVSVLQVVGDGEVRPPLSAAGDGVLVQAGVDRGMPDGSVKATLDRAHVLQVVGERDEDGDNSLMRRDLLQSPSIRHASRSEDSHTFLYAIDKIRGSYRDDAAEDGYNMDDGRDERRWIEGGEMIASAKRPLSIEGNRELRPLYRYIEPERLMHHLTQRMIHASHAGSHTARIRLRPEELGELSMDISVVDNCVSAVIAVDSYDVKEVIEANLHRLDEELRFHGLRIEKFTVEARGGGLEGRFTSAHSGGEGDGRREDQRIVKDRSSDKEVSIEPISIERGLVNIFV